MLESYTCEICRIYTVQGRIDFDVYSTDQRKVKQFKRSIHVDRSLPSKRSWVLIIQCLLSKY